MLLAAGCSSSSHALPSASPSPDLAEQHASTCREGLAALDAWHTSYLADAGDSVKWLTETNTLIGALSALTPDPPTASTITDAITDATAFRRVVAGVSGIEVEVPAATKVVADEAVLVSLCPAT